MDEWESMETGHSGQWQGSNSNQSQGFGGMSGYQQDGSNRNNWRQDRNDNSDSQQQRSWSRSDRGNGFGQKNGRDDGGGLSDDAGTELKIATSMVGRIIGKGGSKIRELQDQSGARIQIDKDSDTYGETIVKISGSAETQSFAKELIEALINPEDGSSRSMDRGSMSDAGFQTELKVSSSMVGRIIGKGGSKIRELQDQSGARIKVDRDSDSYGETTVRISGSQETQAYAKEMIEALIDDGGSMGGGGGGGGGGNTGGWNSNSFGGQRSERYEGGGFSDDAGIELKVASSMVGRIIGKGGSKIRELQDQSGARIKVDRDSDSYGETTVRISGSQDTQAYAKELIEALIDEGGSMGGGNTGGWNSNGGFAQNAGSQTELKVTSDMVGRIIGKGGSKIRELQDQSGARIQVDRESDANGETTVRISGSQETQSAAMEMIEALINQDDWSSQSMGRQ